MSKKLILISVFVLGIIAVIFWLPSSLHGTWYKYDTGKISLFADMVNTTNVSSGENGEEEYLLIYDTLSHGAFCKAVIDRIDIYACVPVDLEKPIVAKGDRLEDIVKKYNIPRSFVAKIKVRNYLLIQNLKISIAALNFDCLRENNCGFQSLDSYRSYEFEFLKNWLEK